MTPKKRLIASAICISTCRYSELRLDDERVDGVSRTLLERVRFDELARMHRAARHAESRPFSGTLRIVLRDGRERRLLARGIRDAKSPGDRSLGILLELD